MSKMYEQIKAWYDAGLWSAKRVRDAAAKGKITAAEAAEILGESEA